MINTVEIAERLSRSFGPEAGRELASVLEAYHEGFRESLFQAEFRQLHDDLRSLVQAQQRTEERLESLAQAQQRTEERLESLVQAQQRTEERLESLARAQQRTEERLESLARAQQRTEERLEALVQRVDALAQAQERTEKRLDSLVERIDSLAQAQQRTQEQLDALIGVVKVHEKRLAKLDGRTLESQFREKASSYMGRVMRGTRVVPVGDLADDLDGVLTDPEWEDLRCADIILKGRTGKPGGWQETYAVVEVSVTLDDSDVHRAARRAALLRKKGWKSVAVAAGEIASVSLIQSAAKLGVAVMENGRQSNWPEALAAA